MVPTNMSHGFLAQVDMVCHTKCLHGLGVYRNRFMLLYYSFAHNQNSVNIHVRDRGKEEQKEEMFRGTAEEEREGRKKGRMEGRHRWMGVSWLPSASCPCEWIRENHMMWLRDMQRPDCWVINASSAGDFFSFKYSKDLAKVNWSN